MYESAQMEAGLIALLLRTSREGNESAQVEAGLIERILR